MSRISKSTDTESGLVVSGIEGRVIWGLTGSFGDDENALKLNVVLVAQFRSTLKYTELYVLSGELYAMGS